MNYWTELSIEYASQRSYLDDLFQVYPTIPESIREINKEKWTLIENAFEQRNNLELLEVLLSLNLFPIKDSYIAYLKRDKDSIKRNPLTVSRICGRLYEMGLNEIFQKCSEPKETNRQIGPLFKRWIQKGTLGLTVLSINEFRNSSENAVLSASDNEMMRFAQETLNYTNNKGLDFVARINNKYVIGEAKFLTDFGGHQNAQFNDAMSILQIPNLKAIPIAILDGVVYIKGNNKMYKNLNKELCNFNIMSSLVLREFLYQI
jgi:Tsp45I type II restriction enzyme